MTHWQDAIVTIHVVHQPNDRPATRHKFGTGFIIHHDETGSFILTCAHVLANASYKIRINAIDGPDAAIVAQSSDSDFDMAVLRVERELLDLPTLPLQTQITPSTTLVSRAASQTAKLITLRDIQFQLNEQQVPEITGHGVRVRGYHLDMIGAHSIQDGFSGAPVVCKQSGAAVGVLAVRQESGQGLAISVAALPHFWKECPDGLLPAPPAEPAKPLPAPIPAGGSRARTHVVVGTITPELEPHYEVVLAYCASLSIPVHDLNRRVPVLAGLEQRLAVTRELLSEARAYVAMVGINYGSIPHDRHHNPDGCSIGELEQRIAVDAGTPIIAVMLEDTYFQDVKDYRKWHTDNQDAASKLVLYKQRLPSLAAMMIEFNNEDRLRRLVTEWLHSLRQAPVQPVPPSAAGASTPKTLIPAPPELYSLPPYTLTKKFIGREAELAKLDAWAHSAEPLMVLQAIGGQGKSALAWEWVRSRAAHVLNPAGVIWWSFYEGGATIAAFVRHALAYVTGQDPEALKETPTYDQVNKLFLALDRSPYLLALDGLERVLKAYHRIDRAQIRDGELSEEQHLRDCADPHDDEFLRRLLAVRSAKILISSRLMPRALEPDAEDGTGVQTIVLNGLQPEDARALMLAHGVKRHSDAVLMPFLESIGYHSLLIQIVAGIVKDHREAPRDFDSWYRRDGQALNLMAMAIDARRTHILQYAFAGLDDVQRRLLAQIAMFSDPITYRTVAIFNPYRPPEPPPPALPPLPQMVPSPFGSPRTARLERALNRAAADERPRLEAELQQQRWLDTMNHSRMQLNRARLEQEWREVSARRMRLLQEHRAAYLSSSAYREGEVRFHAALGELEDRGLLQWDRESNTYDLHPVVRGYAHELLHRDEREQTLVRIRDHFSAVPQPDESRVREVGDIREALLACQALVLAGEYELAARYFTGGLSRLLDRIGAYPAIIELLSPMFTQGFDEPPALAQISDQNLIINYLGRAFEMIGDHEQAARLIRLECNPALIHSRWSGYIGVIRYASYALDMNRIVDALHAMQFAEQIIPPDDRAWVLLDLCLFYLQIGELEQAWEYHNQALAMAEPATHTSDWRLRIARQSLELQRRNGNATHGAYEQVLQQINAARGVRAHLYRLQFSWAQFCLESGDLRGAADHCAQALQLAQQLGFRANAREHMLQARIMRASGDRGRARRLHHDALAALAQLTPDDQAEVLADSAALALELDDPETAARDALRAYELAWADGPPYVVAAPLAKARAVLAQLDVAPPTLPTNHQPAPVPFEEALRELLIGSSKLIDKRPPQQAKFEVTFFRWVQIGTVATFGINNEELITSIARKVSSLSTLSGPAVFSRMGEAVPEPETLEVAVEQRRFDEIDWTFEELRILDKVFTIVFLLSTDPAGNEVFAYVNVRIDRIKNLLDLGAKGEPFNLPDNATKVLTGQGMPTLADREQLQRDYLFGEHHVNVRIFPPLADVT